MEAAALLKNARKRLASQPDPARAVGAAKP
jgi:hypothetical protein